MAAGEQNKCRYSALRSLAVPLVILGTKNLLFGAYLKLAALQALSFPVVRIYKIWMGQIGGPTRPVGRATISDAEAIARLRRTSRLDEGQIERVIRERNASTFRAREIIFDQSEHAPGVVLLLTGVARLTVVSLYGAITTLLGPGDIFVNPSHREFIDFHLEAFTDCNLEQMSADDFAEKILKIPADKFALAIEIAAGPFLDLARRSASWGTLRVRERLISLLIELAPKFGIEDSRGTILGPRLTHRDLAELVGASRPKVTAALSQLVAEQAVIRDGRRLIVLPERLRGLVNSGTRSSNSPEQG